MGWKKYRKSEVPCDPGFRSDCSLQLLPALYCFETTPCLFIDCPSAAGGGALCLEDFVRDVLALLPVSLEICRPFGRVPVSRGAARKRGRQKEYSKNQQLQSSHIFLTVSSLESDSITIEQYITKRVENGTLFYFQVKDGASIWKSS